jgi:hypothetical protein
VLAAAAAVAASAAGGPTAANLAMVAAMEQHATAVSNLGHWHATCSAKLLH